MESTSARDPRRTRRDEAITPVVGTSMILVITVLGMAGVLFWGTPTLQGIQDRGSVVGMEGEFDELRRASLELSVPDASRVPTVVLEDGELSLEKGTRIMTSVPFDTANPSCDFDVTGWGTEGSDELVVDLDGCRFAGTALTSCGTEACIHIRTVSGTGTDAQRIPDSTITWTQSGSQYTATVAGTDFGDGNWLVQINDGTTEYAAAWILGQSRITWRLSTSVTDVQLHLDGGAVFEVDSGSYFLHRPPAIREDAFGSDDYVLRLITINGDNTGTAGRGSPEVFLGFIGGDVRTSTASATQIRYRFAGDIAEAWCQSLLLRNDALAAGTSGNDRVYASDGSCTDAEPSVLYTVSNAGTPQTFPFELLHGRVISSIRV